MKNLFLTLTILLGVSTHAITEGKKGVAAKANKALVQEMVKKYSHNFKKSIETYNNERSNMGAIALRIDSETDRKKFLSYITQNNIKVLPKIIQRNGSAKLKVGSHLIKFSVGTLFDGYFYLNNKKVPLSKAGFDSQVKSMKKLLSPSKKFSFLDLIIKSVHAAGYDKRFEATLIGTTIILNSTFEENSWCVMCEDEYLEATKKNFNKVMQDIARRAKSCKDDSDESERETFAYHLEELSLYASAGYDLQEKLNTYFKSYEDSDLTCDSMVEKLFSEDIAKLKRKKGFYVDSIRIKEVNDYNAKVHKDFIVKKCQPYTELRNCLVDKSYTGRTIYNTEREADGKKRIRSSKSLDKTYKSNSIGR